MGNEWPFEKLKNLSERVSVGHVGPTSEYFCEQDLGIPLIRSQNVRPGKLILSDTKYILPSFHHKLKKSTLKGGDVLVVRVGQNRGDCCIVPQNLGNLNCANVVFIRPNEIIPKFLELYLRSPSGKNALLSISTGSAQGVLNTKAIAEVLAPVPPIQEQKAIANVLGSLDDRIELNRRMNETLEAMAQTLFKSWFVDFDPVIDNALAAGKEIPEALSEKAQARAALGDKRRPLPEEIRILFPDEFTDKGELGWIPKGWEVRQVGELLELAYGKSLPAKKREVGPYPVYGSGGIGGFHNKTIVEGPGIIVGRKGTVGSVFWEPGDFFPIDTVFFVKPKLGVPLYWIYQNLQNMDIASLGADSAVPGVNRNAVYIKEWVLPDSLVLEEYWNQLSTPLNKRQSNNKEAETLSSLRDTLLPKLLSGEIRIPDAEKMAAEAV